MTELKTLKDIEKHYNCGCCDIKKYVENMPEECEIRIKDLKAEAIKWFKGDDLSIFWEWCRINKEFDYLDETKSPLQFIQAFIEWFFNLTEDDLKSCKEVKEQ